ncbi:tetratricopeptide repeat protein [Mangrovimonas spongiae]|uniref:Aerotolerance regulator BatC n=1 Tax=Mangrovimonas spongiae TaxID=2494697 RepID=A0A428K5G4_9FLAO|nr:tetratricopeptide repeat protein [Mangrovimonas spongiae]RSK41639.1 aerotolerance regulator BatC [Mangrovimonas spongiae]
MKPLLSIILLCITSFCWAQDEAEKEQQLALQKANGLVYEANELLGEDDYVSAEMEYRKAISEQPNHTVGAYNLGTSYYLNGSLDEALYRLLQATKAATTKDEKHKAFHNIGNVLYKNKRCKEAVEAYKNALRNNPSDDETRYNYALAKECAEQQKQENEQNQDDKDKDKDQNKDQQDQKDKQDQQDDQDKDNKDEGDQDKKEGEDKKDEDGKPKDEKQDPKDKQGQNQDKKQQQPKPKQGQLSPQQVKNLLEAMNNQEQKVQEKMNAEKQKGVKVQTDKDW